MYFYIFFGNDEDLFDTKVYGDTGTHLYTCTSIYSLATMRTCLILKYMEIQVHIYTHVLLYILWQ